MLNLNTFGSMGELASTAESTATELYLRSFDAPRFALPAGDHYYLTIRQDGRREVVRVIASAGPRLTVVRGEDNTQAQRFIAGACVTVEWNPQQLREFMTSFTSGCEPQPGVAGTHCLGCSTCITVDGCGRITRINGAGGC